MVGKPVVILLAFRKESFVQHKATGPRHDYFRFVPYALRAAQLHEKRIRLKRIFNDLGTFFDPARDKPGTFGRASCSQASEAARPR